MAYRLLELERHALTSRSRGTELNSLPSPEHCCSFPGTAFLAMVIPASQPSQPPKSKQPRDLQLFPSSPASPIPNLSQSPVVPLILFPSPQPTSSASTSLWSTRSSWLSYSNSLCAPAPRCPLLSLSPMLGNVPHISHVLYVINVSTRIS